MDVPLPEYELRRRMSIRLARSLPLVLALMGTVGTALYTLGTALPGMLFGAAAAGLVAAHAVVLTTGWAILQTPRAELTQHADGLPQA